MVSIGDLFSESMDFFKKDMAFYILSFWLVSIIGSLSNGILTPIMTVGYISVIFKRYVGNNASYEDLFQDGFSKFLPALLASICLGFLTIFGMFGLLIGAFIIMIYGTFTSFIVADEDNPDPIEAIKSSFKLVQGHFWYVAAVCIILFFINCVGILCCFVGVLFTAPLSVIIEAILFAHLKAEHEASLN